MLRKFWNHLVRAKFQCSKLGRIPARPRSSSLAVESLETRLAPVIGARAVPAAVAAGAGYDGVVRIERPDGAGYTLHCTGSLLYDLRHVLTAAHCPTDNSGRINQPLLRVTFDLPGGRSISHGVPASSYLLPNSWNGNIDYGYDYALLVLPEVAPAGPGNYGADWYDLYRGSDEVGQTFTTVGYGRTGTGASGQNGSLGVKRKADNRFDARASRLYSNNTTGLLFDFDDGTANGDTFWCHSTHW